MLTGRRQGAIPAALVLAGARLRVECKPLYRSVCAKWSGDAIVGSASRFRQRKTLVVIGDWRVEEG